MVALRDRALFRIANPDAELADRLFVILKADGPMTKDQLYGTTGRRVRARDMNNALLTLLSDGKIEFEMRPTAGRPKEWWAAT